jgi:hypothetical protein
MQYCCILMPLKMAHSFVTAQPGILDVLKVRWGAGLLTFCIHPGNRVCIGKGMLAFFNETLRDSYTILGFT